MIRVLEIDKSADRLTEECQTLKDAMFCRFSTHFIKKRGLKIVFRLKYGSQKLEKAAEAPEITYNAD